MQVRVADASDIGIIRQLAYSIWPVSYSYMLSSEQIQYMLNLFYSENSLQEQMQSGHTFLLLNDGNKPIGFSSYNFIEPKKAKLQKLYVLAEMQGKGCGKILLDAVIDATKKDADELYLNVNRNNKALQFYKREGFIISYEEDIDIGNHYFMNDYVMCKNLKD